MDHRDADAGAEVDLDVDGQQAPQRGLVDVAVHGHHSAVGLEVPQDRQVSEVSGVDDHLGGAELRSALIGQAARSTREMGVGDDR